MMDPKERSSSVNLALSWSQKLRTGLFTIDSTQKKALLALICPKLGLKN